jgi:predicted DCC family thiol-disulfide oxidoreductase YuxK
MTDERDTVYYDGKCPVCTVLADSISSSSQKEAFNLQDIHTTNELPLSHAHHMKDMYVVNAEGTHQGADAILAILSRYPRYRLLARLGKLPFVRPLLMLGYRLFALNRYRLRWFTKRKKEGYTGRQ